MNAYGIAFPTTTTLHANDTVEGEPIERKVERIMNNGEPITDGAPEIYTERNQGVLPEYDIRTDRFELAIDMTDSITKQALAKRAEFHTPKTKDTPPTDTPKA